MMLKQARVRIPGTIRHMRRVIAGIRSPGWRNEGHDGGLCPSPDLVFNRGTFTKTGT